MAAGLYNGQILNLENLSRESEVKRTTVERYFQIDIMPATDFFDALHAGTLF
jgi:hypothetical protein